MMYVGVGENVKAAKRSAAAAMLEHVKEAGLDTDSLEAPNTILSEVSNAMLTALRHSTTSCLR
jgi:hypothetical protein